MPFGPARVISGFASRAGLGPNDRVSPASLSDCCGRSWQLQQSGAAAGHQAGDAQPTYLGDGEAFGLRAVRSKNAWCKPGGGRSLGASETDPLAASFLQTLALLCGEWLEAELPLFLPSAIHPSIRRAMDQATANLSDATQARAISAAAMSERTSDASSRRKPAWAGRHGWGKPVS
jgi:hypothetical protein